jgi:signal transduction histidine kinase
MKLNAGRILARSLSERQLTGVTRFLLLISLLLIIVLSYSYDSINKELIYYSAKVNQAQRILSALKDCSSGTFETAYLSSNHFVSKDTTYTNKTLAALSNLTTHIEKLDTMTAGVHAQSRRSTLLKAHFVLFSDVSRALGVSLQKTDAQLLSDSNFYIQQREGKAMLKLISEMSRVEEKLLYSRTGSRDNYLHKSSKYNQALMFVAIIFLLSSFILLDREISRNKVYRVSLENKVENLNRSNSELEQFAYVASHDLQEPLRKMRSFSDLIISRYHEELPEGAREILKKIEGSAVRMQALMSDLLAFSRLVNTGTSAEPVDLNQLTEQVQSNLSEIIQEHGALITRDELPSVEGYASQLEQVFQNLISNSIKYQKDKIRPEIHIRYQIVRGSDIPQVNPGHHDVDFHLITVSDNGIGFDGEFAEKIFVIFQRLHDRKQFAGTGIGLAICKRVMANHNGYISARSEPGNGADFNIYLPIDSFLT